MAELTRASVLAIKRETTVGEYVEPSANTDFIPLRAGFGMEPGLEELESDELVNDIAPAKSLTGKEQPTGTHPAYFKHSEVEGQEPAYGLLIESAMGARTVNATEYDTVAGSTAGDASNRASINVDAGEGVNFKRGQALLIKDGANGYSIRNVQEVVGDALKLNFNLANAPGSGVNLGKAVHYSPASTGHPSFSATLYNANGGAKQAIAGARTSNISLTFPAAQQATAEFSYAGSEYFYNHMTVDATNDKINFKDLIAGSELTASIERKTYKTPLDLAREIASKMTAASLASQSDTISCSYSSTTGKFTISTSGAEFQLLWKTGTNGADNTDTHIGTLLGYSDAADDTGSTSYVSDSAIDLSTGSLTPSYDDSTNIVVKNAELMLGDFSDNVCLSASNVTVTIDTPQTDVDDLCTESGLGEKLITSRLVTATMTLNLSRYEANLMDKFFRNADVAAMLNIGPRSGGNFVAGKAANIYMPKASVTGQIISGDEVLVAEVSVKGFVTTDEKDVHINFV